MPTRFDSNAIYLGRFGDIDTDESNAINENYGAIPAFQDNLQFARMSYFDADDDGAIRSNDGGVTGETISFDLGAGPVSTRIDGEFRADVRLNYEDGTTYTGNWYFIQTANGDLFMLPDPAGTDPADDAALEAKPIASMNLIAPTRDDYSLTIADRSSVQPAVCFEAATLIDTPDGPRRADSLRICDKVMTLDHGPQAIRFSAGFDVSVATMRADPKLRPVQIPANAFGEGLPRRTLYVTRHHRLLVRSPVVRHAVGVDAALVPAKHFPAIDGVAEVVPKRPMRFVHFCFDRHEIIRANGVWAESLLLGREARKVLNLSPAHSSTPARELCDGSVGATLLSRIAARRKRHDLQDLNA